MSIGGRTTISVRMETNVPCHASQSLQVGTGRNVSRDSVQSANGTVAVLGGSRPLCSGIAPARHRCVRSSDRRTTWRSNLAVCERFRGRQKVATGGRFSGFFQHPYTSEL